MTFFEAIDIVLTTIQCVLALISMGLIVYADGKNIITKKREEYQIDPDYQKAKIWSFLMGVGFVIWSVSVITEPFRNPTIVLHSGRWVIIALFSFMLLVAQWNILVVVFTTFDKPIAAPIFIIESLVVILSISYISFAGRANFIVDRAAKQVCNGSVLTQAMQYNKNATTHPIVLFYTQTGRGWKSADYPPNWLPLSVKEIQLVACIDDDWRIIETCYYRNEIKTYAGNEFETLYRKQLYRTVRVVEAVTGKTLDIFTQTGGVPQKCEFHEAFVTLQTVRVKEGSSIPPKTLFDLLERFADP